MNNHSSDAHTYIHITNMHLVCKSKATEHEHMIVSPSYSYIYCIAPIVVVEYFQKSQKFS